MHVTDTAPLGAEVRDLDLGSLDPELTVRLRDLLADRGVLVFRDQDIDDDAFLAFLRSFGALAFTKGETPLPTHPDLNVISNIGRETPPRSNWHVDTSYVREPPAYTALRAVEVPAAGGETLFSDQYAAYATLPEGIAADIRGRHITHVATGVELDDGDERAATHPIVRPHPRSGRPALYLSRPARCQAVSGLAPEDARELVAALLAHSTRPENVLAHAWAPGDVVIWDNGCVLHRADHSGVSGDRVMHRGMVAAYG